MRVATGDLVRIGGLAAALGIHALFGVPAPADPGLVEAGIGAGLLAAAGLRLPLRIASGALLGRPAAGWCRAGCVAAAALFWPPLLRAAQLGNDPADVLRDVVPLGFLFLPLLLGLALSRDDLPPACPRAVHPGPVHPVPALPVLALGLAGIGVAFALRRLALPAASGTPAFYLGNGPAVAFAAVWLPLLALVPAGLGLPARHPPFRPMVGAVLRLAALAGGGLAFTVLFLDVNRSTFAACTLALALALTLALTLGGAMALRPAGRATALPLLLGLPLLLLADASAGLLGELVRPFVEKTGRVGVNGRGAELAAVAAVAGRDWATLLFGAGWGALMENPAVGGRPVSYTHGLPGYLLLKTGLAGCLAALLWAGALAGPWLRLLRRDFGLALAAAAPVAVGVLFHTGYKHLCFGLLLCLPVLAERAGRRT